MPAWKEEYGRSERHFISGGGRGGRRKRIISLEGSQAPPALPSDRSSLKLKTLVWSEYRPRNFDWHVNVNEPNLGGIIWRSSKQGDGFHKFKWGGLHEKYAVATWVLGTSQHLLYDKGKLKKKLYGDGRSEDLPNRPTERSLESGEKKEGNLQALPSTCVLLLY